MNNAWSWVQETFNNREIATGIWILVAFIACLLLRGVRTGVRDVLKALLPNQTPHPVWLAVFEHCGALLAFLMAGIVDPQAMGSERSYGTFFPGSP